MVAVRSLGARGAEGRGGEEERRHIYRCLLAYPTLDFHFTPRAIQTGRILPTSPAERPTMHAVLGSTSPTILSSILSHLDAPRALSTLSALAATSQALHKAATDDALWRPHFLTSFPASAALLPLLHARGHTIHAYYALRMREQQKRHAPSEQPTPEEKEAWLRAFFADTYLELQVTHNGTGQQVASRLISLEEEEEEEVATARTGGIEGGKKQKQTRTKYPSRVHQRYSQIPTVLCLSFYKNMTTLPSLPLSPVQSSTQSSRAFVCHIVVMKLSLVISKCIPEAGHDDDIVLCTKHSMKSEVGHVQ